MISILFVCRANICRSPALEATLRHLAAQANLSKELHIDSCGTGWVRLGQHPDPRTFASAKKKGILIDHRSQQFQDAFFEEFDWILTVEPEISEQLKLRSGSLEHQAKIRLVTDFSTKSKQQPILDPYYMDRDGFDEVMEQIIDCCEGILRSFFPKRK